MDKKTLIKNLKRASKELLKPYEDRRIEDIDDIAAYYLEYCAELLYMYAPDQLPQRRGKKE